MATNFTWGPGRPLPAIEVHTKRKLHVLRSYLDVYFDTVVPNPATDRLNITLVDGFSGGGAYDDGGETRLGSPFVLLDAVAAAEQRLNEARDKPLEINARFVFIDDHPAHVAALQGELRHRGHEGDPRIKVLTGTFSDYLPSILAEITEKQRVGRSIFFLDQFGYNAVPMAAIQSIFRSLDRAEVILNFAIDGLLNYLPKTPGDQRSLPGLEQFGVDHRFVADWNARKDEAMGRAIIQRALMAQLHQRSGARFFTPFMLRSPTDNRWMMLAHLSQHQTARDKMLGVHWQAQNSFVHVGQGALFTLGYDARLIETCDAFFSFTEADRDNIAVELTDALPRELRTLMGEGELRVADLLQGIGNRTAATNDDILGVVGKLVRGRELEVRSADGRGRRAGSRILMTDRLVHPAQSTLFLGAR